MSVIVFMTLANLRGAKASGTLFRHPDLPVHRRPDAAGRRRVVRLFTGDLAPLPVDQADLIALGAGGSRRLVGVAGALLLARAFSSGAVALTGTEAVTNGIQAFRAPASRNAATTLVMTATIPRRVLLRLVAAGSYAPDSWQQVERVHIVVLLVGGVHRGTLEALAYARALRPDRLVAVHVVSDEGRREGPALLGTRGDRCRPDRRDRPLPRAVRTGHEDRQRRALRTR